VNSKESVQGSRRGESGTGVWVQAETDQRDGPGDQPGDDGHQSFGAVVSDGEVFEPLASTSPWPPKSAIVEAVAHLSIVMMESYALKELSEAEMRRVEKHVASCPKCRFCLEEQLGWAAAMRSPFKRHVEKLIETERKKAAKR
jgi:hypothetical protein